MHRWLATSRVSTTSRRRVSAFARCYYPPIRCSKPLDKRRSFSSLLSVNASNNHAEKLREELQQIEQDIARVNKGQPINVNSPKQVSRAIFGNVQSTSRSALLQAARGEEEPQHANQQQQLLAQLVLQHRELSSQIRQLQPLRNQPSKTPMVQQQQLASFSTIPDSDEIVQEEDSPLLDVSPRERAQVSTPYDNVVDGLFEDDSLIDDYWREPLRCVTKPSARSVVAQLNSRNCPMGYDSQAVPNDPLRGTAIAEAPLSMTAGKKGSLLHYVRDQKQRYSDCVILMRVGEFYESFGLDAIMLVEHCGLNAMAGKARAGCPIRNIQATLDCLTSQGFRVAVYEEAADTDSSAGAGATGGSKARLKNRMLAQIVSSASPTYLYDLVLLGNADTLVTSPASRPYVGIISVASGYTLVEVSLEERSVRVSERLTCEAVACRLAAYPPADPLIYVPSPSEYTESSSSSAVLPFLPSRFDSASDGPGSRVRTKVLPPTLMQSLAPGVTNVERAQNTIVSALIKMTEQQDDGSGATQRQQVTVDDFTLVSSSAAENDNVSSHGTQTNPLHVETATQLGLMSDQTIPSLVSSLLPESSAPVATRRFLRRWLLSPPPPKVADAMSSLVVYLKEQGPALPPLSVPPVGKILALLRAGQASAQVFGELLGAMDSTMEVLDAALFDQSQDLDTLVDPLMVLLEYESGLKADPESVKRRCQDATAIVESVVSPLHHVGSRSFVQDENDGMRDQISEFEQLIPPAYFERNEAAWRGRVRVEAAHAAYEKVQESALTLAKAVAIDFWGLDDGIVANLEDNTQLKLHLKQRLLEIKNPIVQDVFNNLFALRETPSWAAASGDGKESAYIHPRDRNGKLLRNRYTTKRVQDALSDYVSACDEACKEVTLVLTKLSQTLCESGHLPAVVQAAHTNLILSTASHHAAKANNMGWSMAETTETTVEGENEIKTAGRFNDLWPYWMDRSQAVENSFDLKGLFLLTAPNMSGKSTLMRATAAAALLTNCGLCAPVGPDSTVARFDSIFVRGASADVPTEQKSAFGAEMEDIAALFRSCGSKSLVFVDELGRGTSPRDGTCIAGAVLEAMANKGMSGIFATHLHDVFNLPIKTKEGHIVNKRMAIHEHNDDNGDYVWTYRLEDGICTDSMSLVTAKRFGLPKEILDRAQDLASHLDAVGTDGFVSPKLLDARSTVPSTAATRTNGVDRSALNGEMERFSKVIQIAEGVVDQKAHFIRPGWTSPASLEGQSCLYILLLMDGSARYYVGETDSLRNRLKQHRSKGGAWKHAHAVALAVVGGKTQARHLESIMIQTLAKEGYDLRSVSDGRRIRPAS